MLSSVLLLLYGGRARPSFGGRRPQLQQGLLKAYKEYIIPYYPYYHPSKNSTDGANQVQVNGKEHILALPEQCRKSKKLLKLAKKVAQEVGQHRLFRRVIGPSRHYDGRVANPSVAAEIEGQDVLCLKDFKEFCLDLLEDSDHDLVELSKKTYREILWEVVYKFRKDMEKVGATSKDAVRSDPAPRSLSDGFEDVIATRSYTEDTPDRCARAAESEVLVHHDCNDNRSGCY